MNGERLERRMTADGDGPGIDRSCDEDRRRFVVALLASYAASLIPWARPALAQAAPDPDRASFLALSAILAGRVSLDGALAARLFDALRAQDPAFAQAMRSLLTLINDRRIDPVDVQRVLDTEKSPLAKLPRTIVTAWYMGIVGTGEGARVIAYENALNAVTVADVLKPPTYSYGVYGSWTRKPTEGNG
jgi:hypothetical protein